MANSKKIHVKHKHRRRQRAAKEKVQLYMGGKLPPSTELPRLAKELLSRRLRVTKRG